MYYTKEETIKFISSLDESSGDIRIINNKEDVLSKINNGEIASGIFWLRKIKDGEDVSDEINRVGFILEGKTFVKIDEDIYTDDRFAIDAYQAQKDGVAVSEIILQRRQELSEKNVDLSSLEGINIDNFFK